MRRVADIECKIGPVVVREGKTDVHYLTVAIDTSGALDSRMLISLSKDAVFETAEKFLEEKVDDEEVAVENAAEFINVVCGNVVTKMEKEGKKVSISIPKIFKGSETPTIELDSEERAIVAPLSTTKGYCEVQVIMKGVEQGQANKKRVMIIDDSKSVALKLRKIIDKLPDFTVVHHATSAEEGIEKYEELKPDLVTMDIVLPGISGLEATKKIREKFTDANIVVISSVGGGQEKLFEAIQAGAKNVIVKPFDEDRVKEIFYQSV